MAWSAGISRKTWVVPLVGHRISRVATVSALRQADGLLRGRCRRSCCPRRPAGGLSIGFSPAVTTLIRAPMADRLVFLPTSLTVSQWFPCPGFWKRRLWYLSPLTPPPISTNRSTSPSRSQSPQATPCPFWRWPVREDEEMSANRFPSTFLSIRLGTRKP